MEARKRKREEYIQETEEIKAKGKMECRRE
jgi:hypothetical protein